MIERCAREDHGKLKRKIKEGSSGPTSKSRTGLGCKMKKELDQENIKKRKGQWAWPN
jgi:hypothetical protein